MEIASIPRAATPRGRPRATYRRGSRLFPAPELTPPPFHGAALRTTPPYDAAGDSRPVHHPGVHTGATTRPQRDCIRDSHTQDHTRPAPMTAPTRSTSDSDL